MKVITMIKCVSLSIFRSILTHVKDNSRDWISILFPQLKLENNVYQPFRLVYTLKDDDSLMFKTNVIV